MSVIRIKFDYENEFGCCAGCFQLQLTDFRNKIKEQWNRYSNDGKKGIVDIPFEINPNLLFEEPVVTVSGTDLCATHYFNQINSTIEQQSALQEAVNKPRIVPVDGHVIPPNLRN